MRVADLAGPLLIFAELCGVFLVVLVWQSDASFWQGLSWRGLILGVAGAMNAYGLLG
jgi:hypothetical protein